MQNYCMARPLLLDVAVSHHCWCVETTEKTEDCVTKEAKNYTVQDGLARYNATITSSNLDHDIKLVQSHPLVKKLDILGRDGDTVYAAMVSKYGGTVLNALDESGCYHLGEGVSKEGFDNLIVVAPTQKNAKKFFDLTDEDYNVELRAKRKLKNTDMPTSEFFKDAGFMKMKTAVEML